MKDRYDFSKGVRGRFHHLDAKLDFPVYLDEDLGKQLRRRAEKEGIPFTDLVNDLLRREVASMG